MKNKKEEEPGQQGPVENKEQAVALNPNPRANENVRERTATPSENQSKNNRQVGSEITDGEAG